MLPGRLQVAIEHIVLRISKATYAEPLTLCRDRFVFFVYRSLYSDQLNALETRHAFDDAGQNGLAGQFDQHLAWNAGYSHARFYVRDDTHLFVITLCK